MKKSLFLSINMLMIGSICLAAEKDPFAFAEKNFKDTLMAQYGIDLYKADEIWSVHGIRYTMWNDALLKEKEKLTTMQARNEPSSKLAQQETSIKMRQNQLDELYAQIQSLAKRLAEEIPWPAPKKEVDICPQPATMPSHSYTRPPMSPYFVLPNKLTQEEILQWQQNIMKEYNISEKQAKEWFSEWGRNEEILKKLFEEEKAKSGSESGTTTTQVSTTRVQPFPQESKLEVLTYQASVVSRAKDQALALWRTEKSILDPMYKRAEERMSELNQKDRELALEENKRTRMEIQEYLSQRLKPKDIPFAVTSILDVQQSARKVFTPKIVRIGEAAQVYVDLFKLRNEEPKKEDDLFLYKIHLMPKVGFFAEFWIDLLRKINQSESLMRTIHTFKILPFPESYVEGRNAPRIVIYVYGKTNAQSALDEIYHLYKNVPGSGVAPEYNERVTDLIYFTQGNRQDKQERKNDFKFEYKKIYYSIAYGREVLKLQQLEKDFFHLKNPAN